VSAALTAAGPAMLCAGDQRRSAARRSRDLAGIDYVEVQPDRGNLCVHFFGHIPDGLGARHVVVAGGERIRGIQVLDARFHRHDEDEDDCLRVTVDRVGDFSTYQLCLREPIEQPTNCSYGPEPPARTAPPAGIDPRYACAPFSFRVDCPSTLDCRPEPCPAPPRRPAPSIDYLAKDYSSFRRLLLDRLAATLPDWRERHAADLVVTVVEILAYVADQLSYFQDAVGTEAYLRTARRRISVKRHARLVDYRMHDGCNARAFVTVAADSDVDLPLDDLVFAAPGATMARSAGGVAPYSDIASACPAAATFEPVRLDLSLSTVSLKAAHSAIRFHRWREDVCCLPAGATRATLLDQPRLSGEGDEAEPRPEHPEAAGDAARLLALKRGDVLIFEEVVGPETGLPADADPRRRHAVRLSRDPVPAVDPLGGVLVLEVEWDPADALPFALCLSAWTAAPDCRLVETALARGNVLLVDAGRRVTEENQTWGVETRPGPSRCLCDGAAVETSEIIDRPAIVLAASPVTFAAPVQADCGAAALIRQDPREALPAVALDEWRRGEDGETLAGTWTPAVDLLSSGPDDRQFAVEVDDEGVAHLRFPDGQPGSSGSRFSARCRVGNGRAGNVGCNSIVLVASRSGALTGMGLWPRNPLPASGGVDPEPVAEVKLHAPHAFSRVLARAVTGADYAELARRDVRLQGAFAELAWTGSWYEASLALDPLAGAIDAAGTGFGEFSPDLAGCILRGLAPMRRIGHDLRIVRTRRVPLAIGLDVCLQPGHARGEVERALRQLLSSRALPDGRLGFFHPDALGFGQDVIASRLIAAVQLTDGVRRVKLTRFQRLDAAPGEPGDAIIQIAADEVAQLDADPNFPERGMLTLTVEEGR
jgi:hypothetical protein